MRVSRRLALATGSAVVLGVCLGTSWYLLPGPRGCLGAFVPVRCDSGAVNVFGADLFTLVQTVVMAVGIWTAALLLARAIMPSLMATSLGLSIAALAVVVAITLPSPALGAAPSEPCTTPGLSGPVIGACITGPAPSDSRSVDRGLILLAGATAITLGLWRDSRTLTLVS
jgi:hypothetical protein